MPEEVSIWFIVPDGPVSSSNTNRVNSRAEGFNVLEGQAWVMWVLFPNAIGFIRLALHLYWQGCIQLLELLSAP